MRIFSDFSESRQQLVAKSEPANGLTAPASVAELIALHYR